ncbi:MAG: tetratricopeptide repeat protein, partial [Acidobacteriaceae bacterium]
PQDVTRLAAQAAEARQNGDNARAADLYQQALQIDSAWSDGWWYLGQLHYAANDYAQAVGAFTQYLALVPKAAPATALRGLCEFELGQYEPALKDIQQALALGAADDARNAQILHYHEALLLTRLGSFEEALTAYADFAKKGVSNDELLVAVGLAALRMPQMPGDADAAQRAECYAAGNAVFRLMAGDGPGAAQAREEFFARYPAGANVQAANLHYSWGYLLYPTDPDAAIAEFERAVAADAADSVAQTMLAWALLMENEPAAALPEAKKAAAAAPTLPLAQLALGRALLETGDAKGATPVLEAALALDPQNLEVHLALARDYSELGRADEARRERQLCLQMTDRTAKTAPAMGQQHEEPAAP